MPELSLGHLIKWMTVITTVKNLSFRRRRIRDVIGAFNQMEVGDSDTEAAYPLNRRGWVKQVGLKSKSLEQYTF